MVTRRFLSCILDSCVLLVSRHSYCCPCASHRCEQLGPQNNGVFQWLCGGHAQKVRPGRARAAAHELLEEAQAAKAKLEAEKEPEAHFHDGHACTADHSSEHSHDKASAHAHEHDGHACTEDHDHAPHAHEHGHKKSACSEDHSHDGGHAHAGGHEEEHAAAKNF